jgi:hypothetical protein
MTNTALQKRTKLWLLLDLHRDRGDHRTVDSFRDEYGQF